MENVIEYEDEIFIGKMTMQEVLKRLQLKNHRQTISSTHLVESDKSMDSINIIEVNSEPEMCYGRQNSLTETNHSQRQSCSSVNLKSPEKSLNLENMAPNSFMSPKKEESDGTLKYNADSIEKNILHKMCNVQSESKTENNVDLELVTDESTNALEVTIDSFKDCCQLNLKEKSAINKQRPVKSVIPIFRTPSTSVKQRKTNLEVKNKSLKKTHKSNAYNHIASPVAFYIKTSQVPLLKECPKNNLPGPSSIPKPVKNNIEPKSGNKENIILTPVAYKSAKKIQVINLPDQQKMPKSPWAKQMAASLPKPFVIKHDHRETSDKPKPIQTCQDSFADLSLNQAELSICTQKSAFKKL